MFLKEAWAEPNSSQWVSGSLPWNRKIIHGFLPLVLIKVSGWSPNTDLTHDTTSCVIWRVLRWHQSPVKENGVGYLVRARCSVTYNSIQLYSQALAHQEINPSGRWVRRDGADPDRRPEMQGKSKQIHLIREDSPDTSSSCGHLCQVLSQPLMWHWVIYDCLMTLFLTVVFALLFNNFV